MRTKKAATAARQKPLRAKASPKPAKLTPVLLLPPVVTEVINAWSPSKSHPAFSSWDLIAPVVRGHLFAQQINGPEVARKYARALAHHVASRHALGHSIAKAEDLFSDAALETTYGISVISSRSSQTLRAELMMIRRMRANLLPDQYGKNKELIYPRTEVPNPYSQSEINEMLAFARGRTSLLCIKQQGALLLSLSAGLTGAEISNARGSDLIATPWGLFIDTQGLSSGGNRGPRQVPILAAYEEELSSLAKDIGDDLFLGVDGNGENREPGHLTSRAARGPHFKVNRARSTWLQQLLIAGAPYIALRQAGAPVASDKHLAKLSASLELPFERYVAVMRGSTTPFDQSAHEHLIQYALGQ